MCRLSFVSRLSTLCCPAARWLVGWLPFADTVTFRRLYRAHVRVWISSLFCVIDIVANLTCPDLYCDCRRRQINIKGLTGNIRFNKDGHRTDMRLTVLDMAHSGWREAGEWTMHGGINITTNYTRELEEARLSLLNKTLVVTTILVSSRLSKCFINLQAQLVYFSRPFLQFSLTDDSNDHKDSSHSGNNNHQVCYRFASHWETQQYGYRSTCEWGTRARFI